MKTGAVIAVTGGIDIVADSKKAYIIRNGHPLMPRVTGTGCMLTTVIGGVFVVQIDIIFFEVTAAAVSAMGLVVSLAMKG